MAIVTSYDHDTLDFVTNPSTGKKQYNPIPQSRIPSSPHRARNPRSRMLRAVPSHPTPSLPTDPLYILGVPTGQELTIAAKLRAFSAVSAALVPTNRDNLPMTPGTIYIAIPPKALYEIKRQIQTYRWGWLIETPVEPSSVQSLLGAMAPQEMNLSTPAWPVNHPICQLARALWQSRGWHGSLQQEGAVTRWHLQQTDGTSVESPDIEALWRTLEQGWLSGQPMDEILQDYAPSLVGASYPLILEHTPHCGVWTGQWFGQPITIPRAMHANIHLKSSGSAVVWGTLLQTDPTWVFSLVSPDLVTHRLRYRVPYDDSIRVPGQWSVIVVPQVTETTRMHVRQAVRSLGWAERWEAVSSEDPARLVTLVLKPGTMRFDQRHGQQIVHLSRIPNDRKRWIIQTARWLPDWSFDVM